MPSRPYSMEKSESTLGVVVQEPTYGADDARPGQLTCLNDGCHRFRRRERGRLCSACARRTRQRPRPDLFETLGYERSVDQPPAPAARRSGTPGPDRLQPTPAALTTALAVVSVIVFWLWLGPGAGITILVISPLWVTNVLLGGGYDESPLYVFGRVSRFRTSPGRFLTGDYDRR